MLSNALILSTFNVLFDEHVEHRNKSSIRERISKDNADHVVP